MNWKRTAHWCLLLLPFLLLTVWPVPAGAQLGVADGVNALLYEATEVLKLKPLQAGRRIATAALIGTITPAVENPLCLAGVPELLVGPGGTCVLTAFAVGNVDLSTGKGRVRGKGSVHIQDVNLVDGAELEVVRINLHAKIDLSLAVLAGVPLGEIHGRWRATGVYGGPLEGLRARGTFVGTFRLPFIFGLPDGCLDDGDPSDCGFVSPPSYLGAGGSPVDVQPNELVTAVPMVRLEAIFQTQKFKFDDAYDD